MPLHHSGLGYHCGKVTSGTWVRHKSIDLGGPKATQNPDVLAKSQESGKVEGFCGISARFTGLHNIGFMGKLHPKTDLARKVAISTLNLLVIGSLTVTGPPEASAGPVVVSQQLKSTSHPTLKAGLRRASVKTLQKKLNGLRHDHLRVNGSFDANTLSSVKKYQKPSVWRQPVWSMRRHRLS